MERGGEAVEGLSKKEKGLRDMDNSVGIAEGWRYTGLKGNGKNTIKINVPGKKSCIVDIHNEKYVYFITTRIREVMQRH